MHLSRTLSLLILSSTLLTGCLESVVPDHDPNGGSSATGTGGTSGGKGNTTFEEPQLFNMLGAGGYKGNTFTLLNPTTSFVSNLDGTRIKMYVSNDAAAAYEAVTPDATTTTGPAFPVGGIIVREASDANGQLMAITAMVKREAGYFPESGDFFFGVLDPKGQPVTDTGTGVLEWGKVAMCAGCHEPRQAVGYLFGVATADRK